MNSIVRPRRTVLFSKAPRAQVQADLLDIQLHNLIEAINSTQTALADIRRDDGKLRSGSVGQDQLATEIKHTRDEIDTIEGNIIALAAQVTTAAGQVAQIARDIHLRALDAEKAATATLGAVSQTTHNLKSTFSDASDAENSADRSEAAAIASQNSANYSHAQADNAIHANNEATQWAEYLAGPVVNPNDAPAYIQSHPYGHGLYYQPVEGGVAGLWSAKWWALQAYQLVGHWNFYYLGAWADPPFPGMTNPDTGLTPPNPLAPGSFYYNTTNNQLYIWDGTQWTTPISLTAAYLDNFVYIATAGQKVFSGPDRDGKIPNVANSPSDVHLNGIKLVMTTDYTIDAPGNALHLVVGAAAGAVVQWDLLVPTSDLAPGAISVFKIQMTPVPDGVNRTFAMTYTHPTLGSKPTAATQIAEINISLDGIVQEPGVDFSISGGSTLNMAQPPLLNSRFWGTWHASDLIVP